MIQKMIIIKYRILLKDVHGECMRVSQQSHFYIVRKQECQEGT